jgi:hypothetical protein
MPGVCRPYSGAKRKSLHWLNHRGKLNVGEWWDRESQFGEVWFLIGVEKPFTPEEMRMIGRTYIGPAEPMVPIRAAS